MQFGCGALAEIIHVSAQPVAPSLGITASALAASEPLVYEYTYDEMKVVVQGEFILTDQATGDVTHAKERDVLFFPKGTTVKFETPDYALGFYTGHRSFAP